MSGKLIVDNLEWITESLTVTSNDVLLPTFPDYKKVFKYVHTVGLALEVGSFIIPFLLAITSNEPLYMKMITEYSAIESIDQH